MISNTTNYPFIVQFNANSIKERPTFLAWIQQEQPIVVALQETLINDKNDELFAWPAGYTVIKNLTSYNTNGRPIGGSVLLIKQENFIRDINNNNNTIYDDTSDTEDTTSDSDTYNTTTTDTTSDSDNSNKFDTVMARIQIGKKQCTVCSFYWKQGRQHDATEEELASFIEALPHPFILMGDMNAKSTLWLDKILYFTYFHELYSLKIK